MRITEEFPITIYAILPVKTSATTPGIPGFIETNTVDGFTVLNEKARRPSSESDVHRDEPAEERRAVHMAGTSSGEQTSAISQKEMARTHPILVEILKFSHRMVFINLGGLCWATVAALQKGFNSSCHLRKCSRLFSTCLSIGWLLPTSTRSRRFSRAGRWRLPIPPWRGIS